MGTQHKGRKCIQKTQFRSDRQPNSNLCVNTYIHPYTWQENYSPSCWNQLLATLTLFGEAESSEALARPVRWISVRLPHLTLIDPAGQKNCGSTCSMMVNYHFKEAPRKGYPFEQNASIHASKEMPAFTIVTVLRPRECAVLKSIFFHSQPKFELISLLHQQFTKYTFDRLRLWTMMLV